MLNKKGQVIGVGTIKSFAFLLVFAIIIVILYFTQYNFNTQVQAANLTQFGADIHAGNYSQAFTDTYVLWNDVLTPILYIVLIIIYCVVARKTQSDYVFYVASVLMMIFTFTYILIIPDIWAGFKATPLLSARISELVFTDYMMSFPYPFAALFIIAVIGCAYYRKAETGQ